jgi:hypothetical protein
VPALGQSSVRSDGLCTLQLASLQVHWTILGNGPGTLATFIPLARPGVSVREHITDVHDHVVAPQTYSGFSEGSAHMGKFDDDSLAAAYAEAFPIPVEELCG